MESYFFHFDQNNSHGRFIINDDIDHKGVVIEAVNLTDALHRAEAIGLYFDGQGGEYIKDCEHCGPRWERFPVVIRKSDLADYLTPGMVLHPL